MYCLLLQFVVVLVAVAVSASAQYLTPTVTHQDSNIYRSYGNLGQVSTFSKSINTPYSSVHKADVRISNPGYAVAAPISHGYVAPATYAHGPAVVSNYGAYAPASYAHGAYGNGVYGNGAYAAPVAKVNGAGLLGVAYSVAPAVSHMTYSNGLGYNYAW